MPIIFLKEKLKKKTNAAFIEGVQEGSWVAALGCVGGAFGRLRCLRVGPRWAAAAVQRGPTQPEHGSNTARTRPNAAKRGPNTRGQTRPNAQHDRGLVAAYILAVFKFLIKVEFLKLNFQKKLISMPYCFLTIPPRHTISFCRPAPIVKFSFLFHPSLRFRIACPRRSNRHITYATRS